MAIKRLNHAVLYVRRRQASAAFYTEVLGFLSPPRMGDQAFFLRADGSTNDHDLALFSVGARPAAPHSVGLYHLAWQVHTLEELVAMRATSGRGGLAGRRERPRREQEPVREGPDGIEFEVMWAVPRGRLAGDMGTWRLDLDLVGAGPLGGRASTRRPTSLVAASGFSPAGPRYSSAASSSAGAGSV
jgi:catechol 2,3-dioxygenase-like lactoylglutathione lyase family enzyme